MKKRKIDLALLILAIAIIIGLCIDMFYPKGNSKSKTEKEMEKQFIDSPLPENTKSAFDSIKDLHQKKLEA